MKKILFDTILFVLFVAELSFYYLPKILHEILGVIMAVAIIVHIFINRRHVVNLFKDISPQKIFITEVNIMLTIFVLLIIPTGICMSNHLFPDAVSFAVRRNMTIHSLHVSAPYAMMVFVGMHIGLHWQEVKQKLLNFFGAEEFYNRRRNFLRVIVLFMSAIGVAGLFLNRFLDRVLMEHVFATPATDLPLALFILLIICGIVFFAMITYILDKKFFRHRKLF